MLDNKAHTCLQQRREGLLSSALSTLYPAGEKLPLHPSHPQKKKKTWKILAASSVAPKRDLPFDEQLVLQACVWLLM